MEVISRDGYVQSREVGNSRHFFLRGCHMKEFLLVMIGFILGSAIGVDGFMEIVNKVIGLFS